MLIIHCQEAKYKNRENYWEAGTSLIVQTVKNLLASGRPRFDPLSGRSPGEGNGYLLHYSCLENSVDRGAWLAGGLQSMELQSQTRLSDYICMLWLVFCFCQLSISILHSFFEIFSKNLFLEKISPYVS